MGVHYFGLSGRIAEIVLLPLCYTMMLETTSFINRKCAAKYHHQKIILLKSSNHMIWRRKKHVLSAIPSQESVKTLNLVVSFNKQKLTFTNLFPLYILKLWLYANLWLK
jgi:hypothetical protein